MRIKYSDKNKEEGTGRFAIIHFTDDEYELYEYIANYENTFGDETRKFFNGRIFRIERNEKGVWINEAYIDVDDFDDFIEFKANYKEAKKKFKSLKKHSSETEDATEKEPEKVEKELIEPGDTHIDDIKKFKAKRAINSLYGITSSFEIGEDFHRLTKTLIISLFKAIGIQDTMKLSFTIANDIVFFNYKDTQYKYYPPQCKIFKKCGRKYQRINWKDFADDNVPNDQKQAFGRSPPFTPNIRSSTINDLK